MTHKFPNSISDAAKLLDKVMSGWADKIDIEQLDFKNGNKCLLGQLYGDYAKGMEELFGDDDDYEDDEDDGIFEYDADKSAWLPEIKKRLKKSLTFLEALQAMQDGKKVSFTTNGGVFRVLAKSIDNQIVDILDTYGDRKNPSIFAFWNYNFAIWEPKPKFTEITIGSTFKYEGKKYIRTLQSIDFNAIGEDLTKINLATYAEVEHV